MPRLTYEEHLAAARKHETRSQLNGLLKPSGKFQGLPQDPRHPWRGSLSWEEHDQWKRESEQLRGD